MESVSILPVFWLSVATGHNFSLVGHYLFEFRALGRVLTRPFYVISDLSKCETILEIDFIKETQLCISGNNVFFTNLFVSDNIQCSVITAIEDFSPRSILRIPVSVRSARGKKIVKVTYGICATAFDKLGLWGSLNEVDYEGNIFAAQLMRTQGCELNNKTWLTHELSDAWPFLTSLHLNCNLARLFVHSHCFCSCFHSALAAVFSRTCNSSRHAKKKSCSHFR